MKRSGLCILLIILISATAVLVPVFDVDWLGKFFSWGTVSLAVMALAVAAFFFEFENRAVSSKEIALVAMLGTVSAVFRIPFAAIPSVQPCTYLIICTGYVFGPLSGFIVGAVTALVSNFFLGQGPWTIYQMFGWGLAGVAAAYLRRVNLDLKWLIALGIAWGFIFGAITNLWFWTSFIYPLTMRTFLLYQLQSVWFDTFHAISNAVFLILFGRKTIDILERFRNKFQWRSIEPGASLS